VTAMLEIPGEIDRGHPPAAELALDYVTVAQGVSQFGSCLLDHDETWEVGGTLRICADEAFLASARGSEGRVGGGRVNEPPTITRRKWCSTREAFEKSYKRLDGHRIGSCGKEAANSDI
jgi:hypothetical protein